jgi:hypothetical protein
LDVVDLMVTLTGMGSHPQFEYAQAGERRVRDEYSAVFSVENIEDGGRLLNYPPNPVDAFPDRPAIVQIGVYHIDPDANILGLLSSSALVVVSPQQEALEELLASLGGEDFFMLPPSVVVIRWLGEDEEEEWEEWEEWEDEDEWSFLQRPYIYGTPDLNNVKDMPSLLGQDVDEEGELLKLSFLDI